VPKDPFQKIPTAVEYVVQPPPGGETDLLSALPTTALLETPSLLPAEVEAVADGAQGIVATPGQELVAAGGSTLATGREYRRPSPRPDADPVLVRTLALFDRISAGVLVNPYLGDVYNELADLTNLLHDRVK
jgi:hypothetical protein